MKREANKGMVLYEEVLQKNFEIIQTFLNKFPLIFKKQDFFQESIKKLNEKIVKQDQDQDKLREELQLTSSLLEKKIQNTRENSARQSRSSFRASQQFVPLEQRKNSSIFRGNSAFKDQGQTNRTYFSKEKNELINEMQRKQQENTKKIEEMDETITNLKQKLNFLSVLESKNQEKIDTLKEDKVYIGAFDQLSNKFYNQFQEALNKMVEEKYYVGTKHIDKKVGLMQATLSKYIDNLAIKTKTQLKVQIQKKVAVNDFKQQVGQIKTIIQRMVQESVQSFASKEETKKVLLLFQKKFIKIQLVLEEILNQALQNDSEKQPFQFSTLPARKEKEMLTGFGRKRRIQK